MKCYILSPSLLKFVGMKELPAFIQDFFLNIVTQTIKRREATGEIRKDLMQYLIQLRNNSSSEDCNTTDPVGNYIIMQQQCSYNRTNVESSFM